MEEELKSSGLPFIMIMVCSLLVFTNAKAQEPYAVLSDNNTTLTFYYDENMENRNGLNLKRSTDPVINFYVEPEWKDYKKDISTVVFDDSFASCTSITQTIYWFSGCSNLATIKGIENFNTRRVFNMDSMFDGCSSLTSLDISHFDTSNVIDMGNMFKGCSALKELDVSHFNTNIVTEMNSMFEGCSSLKTLDVSRFNTSNVLTMSAMFKGCSSLDSLDVSRFNTNNVVYYRGSMSEMFKDCSSLECLDLRSFNTDRVTNMTRMFYNCKKLTTIYCDDTWNCGESVEMFGNCESLRGICEYEKFKIDAEYANPTFGYFTSNDSKATEIIHPYVVWSEDKTTFTFYYDDKRTSRRGTLIGISSLSSYSYNNIKQEIVTVVFDKSFSDCNVSSTNGWFRNCTQLTTIEGLENLNTWNVKDMSYMFYRCSSLTSLDLTHFDTSTVGDMRYMFTTCRKLTTIYCNDTWHCPQSYQMFHYCNTLEGAMKYDSECTDVNYANPSTGYFTATSSNVSALTPYAVLSNDSTTLTFYYDTEIEKRSGKVIQQVEILPSKSVVPWWFMFRNVITTVNFDTSMSRCNSITNMSCWFYYFRKLVTITGLENLNTSNVRDMGWMFCNCSSLTTLDLSHFDTSNVTNMAYMFENCTSLASLNLSSFNTANVTDMSSMFQQCDLSTLDVKHFNTAKVTDMRDMFYLLEKVKSLDLSSFNTANVTDMQGMFACCFNLESVDVSSFDTGKVKNMETMFLHCYNLKELDVSRFNTSNVTNMNNMFGDCYRLENLDVSNFDTSNVTDMGGMFGNCHWLENLDVRNFNTANVTNMGGMFGECSSLTNLDVSRFNTSNVTNMNSMFTRCISLEMLDVSRFNTSNVTNMNMMFFLCRKIKSLDLSSFDTRKVMGMAYMFQECDSLKTIYASDNWNMDVVEEGADIDMFYYCRNLVGGKGTIYDSMHTDRSYARIDNGTEAPGYFTLRESSAGPTNIYNSPLNRTRAYKLSGIRTIESNKGFYVIQMSDGTCRKVIIR